MTLPGASFRLLRSKGRQLWRRQQGQSAVELALVLPLLMILLTGIGSYGMAINNYVTLQEATGAGTRLLAIERGEGGDPCALAAAAIASDAPGLTNNGSTVSGLGYTMVVNGLTYASATPTCPSATFTAGQPVSITTTYPCTLRIFRVASLNSCYLSATNTEVIQ